MNAIGRVRATVTEKDTTSVSTRYIITSLTDNDKFTNAERKHWSVENQLHWCLDVIFKEDDSRARKDNSPLNLNVMRKMALALCKNCKNENLKKNSIQKRIYRASLNPEVLMSILFG